MNTTHHENNDGERLMELVQKEQADELSVTEGFELQELLAKNPEARRQYGRCAKRTQIERMVAATMTQRPRERGLGLA